MRPALAVVFGSVLLAAVAGLPVLHRSRASVEYRNFRVVDDGVLYRSGQMTPAGFRRVVREFGVRTVVCLRDRKDGAGENDDRDEVEACGAAGVAFHRFPLADWGAVNGVVPGDRNVARFVALMADPATPKPVLVHCFAGIHRTGPLVAAYRMEQCGWSPADAVDELTGMGTVRTTFDRDLIDYLLAYTPRRGPPPVNRSGT